MARILLLVALFSLFGLTSCSAFQPVTGTKYAETQETVTQRQFLIGRWQGSDPVRGGGRRTWTVQRYRDGTYKIDFTFTGVSDVPDTQSEMGVWGVSGGIYFTATRTFADSSGTVDANTNDPSFYDTYKIIALTNETFEYQSLSTGDRFVVRKMHASAGVP